MPVADVFSLVLFDRFLIYAPLHHLSALVDRQAVIQALAAITA